MKPINKLRSSNVVEYNKIPDQREPSVTLLSHTDDPLYAIAMAVEAWESDDLMPLDRKDHTKILRHVNKALRAYHRTALEYVSLTFLIKNVSRAFQQQLTRTRLASYSIQSLRVVSKKGFATGGHYTMPPNLDEFKKAQFHVAMLQIQDQYEYFIEKGFDPEDARGILPLNIHSDITMTINLNALYHMTEQRLCLNTQHEYRNVVMRIAKEIRTKLHPVLADRISAPCVKVNKCAVKEFCGIKVWELNREGQELAYETYSKNRSKK